MSGHDPMDEFEARVRAALQRDGEQIHPHGDGLARIRERTAEGRRNWLMAGVVGLATATAIVGAFFVSSDLLDLSSEPERAVPPAAESTEPERSPEPTPTPTPSPEPTQQQDDGTTGPSDPESPSGQPAPAQQVTVPVYYVGETTTGLRLFREFHSVQSSEPEAVTALNEMLQKRPADPDYSSPWAPGSRALSVDTGGGQITVDLNAAVLDTDVPRETADLMVQQLIYTVQAALQDAGSPVQILVQGQPVSDISGSPTAEGLARADAVDVQALTWVIEPFQGATVPQTFQVKGIANAFEATVSWQLVGDGQVVKEGFTTAEEGQTFSPYSFTIRQVPPGSYTVRVFQSSPEDGSQTFVDTKAITVE